MFIFKAQTAREIVTVFYQVLIFLFNTKPHRGVKA